MLTPSLSINLPPEPRDISNKGFFCAFVLSLLEKIKDGGDSCFRDISRTSVKQSVPDPPIKAGAVTSSLHQMLKYPVKGKIITVHGEEEYMISHLNSFRYVEVEGEFIETPFQHFEEISLEVAVAKTVAEVPKQVARMASLKDADRKSVV